MLSHTQPKSAKVKLSENDAGDMNFVCGLLTQVTIEKRIAVDIPHHVHKGDIAPGDADAGRGSSGIKDAGRLVSTLTVMSEKEAKDFDIEPEDRFDYVRLDRAKVNIARRAGAAEWFKLAGVPLNNGNETYPSGDTVQVAEPWKPPETSAWKGLSYACLNKALDSIDGGVVNDKGFTGERYSAAPQAKRAAWKAVQVIVGMEADKSDADCKAMVKAWLKSGTLVEKDYTDPIQRKEVKGLFVDNSKRPGKTDSEERL
jgi:hypothetical protein